jgi:hypothetical protein
MVGLEVKVLITGAFERGAGGGGAGAAAPAAGFEGITVLLTMADLAVALSDLAVAHPEMARAIKVMKMRTTINGLLMVKSIPS